MKIIHSLKSFVAASLSVIAFLVATGCSFEYSVTISGIDPSGVNVTRSGALTLYDKLDVSSCVNVSFEIGNDYAYTLTADSLIVDSYEVVLEGSKLKVHKKNGVSISLKSNSEVSLVLTVPSYDAFSSLDIDLSGASKVTIPEFNMSNLNVDCSGASRANIAGTKVADKLSLDCSGASSAVLEGVSIADLACDCSGASTATINGVVSKFSCDCSGASSVISSDLKINESASYDCSGASRVTTGDLTDIAVDFRASGASSISYSGEPRVNSMNATGASRIKN